MTVQSNYKTNTHVGFLIAKQTAILFIPIITLLALVMGLFYNHAKSEAIDTLLRQDNALLRTLKHKITFNLDSAYSDILLTRKITESMLSDNINFAALADTYKQIVESRYAQIKQLRFIDVNGLEKVRLDTIDDRVVIANSEFLQNKQGRYYVKEGLSLRPGQIYQSPLDLNVEFSVIEFPYRPMIRLVSPVYDDEAILRGIVVVNFNAQIMFSDFDWLSESSNADIWLLNNAGYWLYSSKQDIEWGFMFGSPNLTIGERYPRLAELMSKHQGVSFGSIFRISNQGIFTVNDWRINDPALSHSVNDISTPWRAVAYLSNEQLALVSHPLRLRFLGMWSLVSIPILCLSIGFAFLYARRESFVKALSDEHELRLAESKYKLALNSSNAPVMLVDKNQNIILANNAAARLFEFENNTNLNLSLSALIPASFQKRHIELVDAFLNRTQYVTPETNGNQNTNTPPDTIFNLKREVPAITLTGRELSIEICLSNLDVNGSLFTLATITDITECKMLEARLAKSNRSMLLAMGTAKVGVWSWVVGEDSISWDDHMYLLFEYPKNPIKPITFKEWRQRIHPDDLLLLDRIFKEALSSSDSQQYQFRFFGGDGEIRWIKGGVVREVINSQTRLVGINIDITEERMSQNSAFADNLELKRHLNQSAIDLQHVNKELETFSNVLSHDLRIPLRGIEGFSDQLFNRLGDSLLPLEKDSLLQIKASANQMDDLIDSVLSLSRIRLADIVRKRLDLAEMSRSIIKQLREKEPTRNVSLIAPDHLYANADSALLRMVLNYLITNAWQFTQRLEHAVIELGSVSEGGNDVYFIRDNGQGIDKTYIAHLFDVDMDFHPASEAIGFGVGLAIAERVIEKHHGKIWAESDIGKGATFYFTLTS